MKVLFRSHISRTRNHTIHHWHVRSRSAPAGGIFQGQGIAQQPFPLALLPIKQQPHNSRVTQQIASGLCHRFYTRIYTSNRIGVSIKLAALFTTLPRAISHPKRSQKPVKRKCTQIYLDGKIADGRWRQTADTKPDSRRRVDRYTVPEEQRRETGRTERCSLT